MIDRKILDFIRSLNEEEREELIKNLENNTVILRCDDAIMCNEEILKHIYNDSKTSEENKMKYYLKTVSSTFQLQLFLDTCNTNDYKIQFVTERNNEILIIYTV